MTTYHVHCVSRPHVQAGWGHHFPGSLQDFWYHNDHLLDATTVVVRAFEEVEGDSLARFSFDPTSDFPLDDVKGDIVAWPQPVGAGRKRRVRSMLLPELRAEFFAIEGHGPHLLSRLRVDGPVERAYRIGYNVHHRHRLSSWVDNHPRR